MRRSLSFSLPTVTLCLLIGCGSSPAPRAKAPEPGQAARLTCLTQDFAPTPAGAQLAVPYRGQSCTSWIGAEALSMLAAYYDVDIPAHQLMSTKAGIGCGLKGCQYSGCSSALDSDEMSFILRTILHIEATHVPDTLSEESLQVELSSGRPMLLGFDGPIDGNYAVLSGFRPGNPATYHVLSPWAQVGDTWRTRAQLIADPQTGAHWTQTWYGALPPESYCRKHSPAPRSMVP